MQGLKLNHKNYVLGVYVVRMYIIRTCYGFRRDFIAGTYIHRSQQDIIIRFFHYFIASV